LIVNLNTALAQPCILIFHADSFVIIKLILHILDMFLLTQNKINHSIYSFINNTKMELDSHQLLLLKIPFLLFHAKHFCQN
jgi:hypothetical protein